MKVYLGLGTNLGDREMNLVMAKDLLMKHDVLVIGQSSVLETEPLGGLDQPMYLNQVIEAQTELGPELLLTVCKTVEKEMGRPLGLTGGNVSFGQGKGEIVRTGQEQSRLRRVWKSRIIDIDILFYGDWVVDLPHLQIPHQGVLERDFVLHGLLELAPDFVHPVTKKPLKGYHHPSRSEAKYST